MSIILNILVIMCIYSILTISLNLELGFTGLFNLCQAAFWGIGAYTAALLALAGVSFWASILAGALLAAACGAFLGGTTLGLKGDYLCIATVGFGEIVKAVLTNWTSLTGGTMGLPGIPRPIIFGYQLNSNYAYLILTIIFLVICWVSTEKLVRFPFGRVLRGIKEDQLATVSIGKDIRMFKMVCFIFGSAWAGIAGSLYAYYVTFIAPTSFTLSLSVTLMLAVILGGMGNNKGVFAATIFIVLIQEGARFIGLPPGIEAPIQQAVWSVILIIIVLFRPNGLFSRKKPSQSLN